MSVANGRGVCFCRLMRSGFGGVLPAAPGASIPDCTLYNDRWTAAASGPGNNVFACPLARGAETCGAACAHELGR